MKITVWTLTVEYEDVLETKAFTTEDKADQYLVAWFDAEHDVWRPFHDEPGAFDQDELDALTPSEFRDLLNDYGVTNVIEPHELEV
ncbi:hypothetical protein SEA_SUPERCHUNK_80 [Mycobacterium phage Superchunk]|nr:hypothetical protein SEA_SUPERCHUNK_80 [Mycobacterium phage Superchunk]